MKQSHLSGTNGHLNGHLPLLYPSFVGQGVEAHCPAPLIEGDSPCCICLRARTQKAAPPEMPHRMSFEPTRQRIARYGLAPRSSRCTGYCDSDHSTPRRAPRIGTSVAERRTRSTGVRVEACRPAFSRATTVTPLHVPIAAASGRSLAQWKF